MTPEQHETVGRLFLSASKLEAGEVDPFLDEACQGDETVRLKVLDMLARSRKPALDLDSPALGDRPAMIADALRSAPATVPDRIGDYEIMDRLGMGGMGVVYRARQQNPQRMVALKVVRTDMRSDRLLTRFQHEAQVLGRLQHPGIAQIYEAGAAESLDGRVPYFAMELVDGQPLTEFAEAQQLGSRERLRLIALICDAVQHAHVKGVIHRDLKPANILVTNDDSGERPLDSPAANINGLPKILDFGVARAVNSDVKATTMRTDVGKLIGTLSYMSPEQTLGDPLAVDARADVYALGVVTYELLSGTLPYDLAGRSIPDAVRVISDQEHTPLSSMNPVLRGDLETIVAKSLEKNRDQRYQSPGELAADIRRFLNDEPILARPATFGYQFRKFAKRNRALVSAAMIGLAAMLIGVGGLAWGLVAARRQATVAGLAKAQAEQDRGIAVKASDEANQRRRQAEDALDEADRQTRIAEAVNGFLRDLLSQANPIMRHDADVTVREIVQEASDRIETHLDAEPEVRAAIFYTLGITWRGLGDYEKAREHLVNALELCREHLPENDTLTIQCLSHLASVHERLRLAEAGIALNLEALERSRETLGPEHATTLTNMHNLAVLYMGQGRLDEAEELLDDVIKIATRVKGEKDPLTASYRHALANLHTARGEFRKALEIHRQVHALRLMTIGEEHPHTLGSMQSISELCYTLAEYKEAEAFARPVFEIRLRILGEQHPDTHAAMNTLGLLCFESKKFDEAERLFKRSLALESPGTLEASAVMNNLALLYIDQERFEEAVAMMTEAIDIRTEKLGASHPDTIMGSFNLAGLLARQLKYTEALDRYEEIASAAAESLPAGHFYIGLIYTDYGQCLARLDRYEEGERVLLEAHQVLVAALGEQHERTLIAARGLADLYKAWQKPERAAEWERKKEGA